MSEVIKSELDLKREDLEKLEKKYEEKKREFEQLKNNDGGILHEEIKKAVDNNDVDTLKYNFCDCFDGDPIFEKSREDYEYCKSKGVLFVPHEDLHKMSLDSVDELYWLQLKKDFMSNPSVKRFEHMIEAAKIFYKDRIERIEKNRKDKIEQKQHELDDLKSKCEQRRIELGNLERKEKERLEKERSERERVQESSDKNNDGVQRKIERQNCKKEEENNAEATDSAATDCAVRVIVGASVGAVLLGAIARPVCGAAVGILVGAVVGAFVGSFLGSKSKFARKSDSCPYKDSSKKKSRKKGKGSK